jgi:hypothetical protein
VDVDVDLMTKKWFLYAALPYHPDAMAQTFAPIDAGLCRRLEAVAEWKAVAEFKVVPVCIVFIIQYDTSEASASSQRSSSSSAACSQERRL